MCFAFFFLHAFAFFLTTKNRYWLNKIAFDKRRMRSNERHRSGVCCVQSSETDRKGGQDFQRVFKEKREKRKLLLLLACDGMRRSFYCDRICIRSIIHIITKIEHVTVTQRSSLCSNLSKKTRTEKCMCAL